MMRLSVLVSLLAVGCAGGRPATGTTVDGASDGSSVGAGGLCDGTERLRLRVDYEGGGQEVTASYVRVENGYQFFMVDGICRYWIGGSWVDEIESRDRPVLTGTLGTVEAMNLESALPLARVAELADCTGPRPADAGERVIRVEGASARCPGGAGTRFDAAWTGVGALVTRLRPQARAAEGAIHVSAVSADPPPGTRAPYAWPLTAAVDSFFVDTGPGNPSGRSHLVTNPMDAAALRALRDQYLAERTATPGPFASWDGLRVVAAGQHAVVFMRDALPYEDARGLITF